MNYYVLEQMRAQGMNYAEVSTGGDSLHVPARHAYEKVGFVPLPLFRYYKTL